VAADATLSGSGSSSITATADGGATSPGPDVTWSADASASDIESFATAGPVRPGLVGLLIDGFGGLAGASFTTNGASFGIGIGSCCLPFELGTVFQVSVSAGGGGGGGPANAEESSASVSFSITEADGITPVPFFTVVTPEPVTWGLLLLGLSASAMFPARKEG